MIQKFKEDIKLYMEGQSIPVKQLKHNHARLGELLMQSLLKVDGVTFDSSFEMARMKRKQTVTYFQDLLESVDKLREQAKL